MSNQFKNYAQGTFAEDIRKFVGMSEKNLTKKFRRVSLKALGMVVIDTPVKTGCARGNWNVQIGNPNTDFHPEKADKAGGATITEGKSVIDTSEPDKTLFLTNSTPYIGILEFKKNMVHLAVTALKNALEHGQI